MSENYYCLHIKYVKTDCYDQVEEFDDQYIFAVPQDGELKKLVGSYIRKNLRKRILNILEEALYWECMAYNDECFAFKGQENEEGGEVFDLPDKLFQIYRIRRENRNDDKCDLYSDYHCSFDFDDDIKSLSDQDIFELIVQNEECSYEDSMGGGEMTYESSFTQIESVSPKQFIHHVDQPKMKLNLKIRK